MVRALENTKIRTLTCLFGRIFRCNSGYIACYAPYVATKATTKNPAQITYFNLFQIPYVKLGKEQCNGFRTDHEHEAPFFMEFYWGDFFRQKPPLTIKDLEVCKSIPYLETCLDDEVGQLKAIYGDAMKLAASDDAKKYFEDQGLDPWDYGFNPSQEQILKLEFSGYKDACEEPVIPVTQ